MMNDSITNKKYSKSIAIMGLVLAVLLVPVSCEEIFKPDKIYRRESHMTLDFHVEDVLYYVVRTSYAPFGARQTEMVGARFSRVRNEVGLPIGKMSAECEREDTLAIGAGLTSSTLESDILCAGSIFFLLPYSKIVIGSHVVLSPSDVYFFSGYEMRPTNRASISSFIVTFSEVSLYDDPEESIVRGTFEMSGVDCEGVSFKTTDGYFEVVASSTKFNPFSYCIDYYKKKYENN